MSFDPYQVLGVQPTATADEIRKVYRALARRYHPDVNKSASAEDRFKLLAQAYSVLSDAKRRALFDEFGEDSLALGFDPELARAPRPPVDASPPRRSAAREGAPRAKRRTEDGEVTQSRRRAAGLQRERSSAGRRAAAADEGPDVYSAIDIDLATALRGGEVKVTSASGALLAVQLPPGVENGHRVRLKGRGRAGQRGGLPGDLYLDVHVRPHPFFHRDGSDLLLDLPVTIEEAHQGASVEIPTLEGWVRLPIPAGSRGGEKLRLRGKGLPGADGGRGDLYVHLCIRLPDRLEAAGRTLERLFGLYSEDVRAGLRL